MPIVMHKATVFIVSILVGSLVLYAALNGMHAYLYSQFPDSVETRVNIVSAIFGALTGGWASALTSGYPSLIKKFQKENVKRQRDIDYLRSRPNHRY